MYSTVARKTSLDSYSLPYLPDGKWHILQAFESFGGGSCVESNAELSGVWAALNATVAIQRPFRVVIQSKASVTVCFGAYTSQSGLRGSSPMSLSTLAQRL